MGGGVSVCWGGGGLLQPFSEKKCTGFEEPRLSFVFLNMKKLLQQFNNYNLKYYTLNREMYDFHIFAIHGAAHHI